MRLKFAKMEGAGNDFVVLDATKMKQDELLLKQDLLRKLADRHYGVGCDQILVVESAGDPGIDFRYRIFNADGGEVEQCGNGARCFVKYVHARGLTAKRAIRVQTLGGVIVPRLEEDGEVSVDMGPPVLASPLVEKLSLQGETVELAILSIGNPHAVQVVPDVEAAPVGTQGPLLERHPRFPERVRLEIVHDITPYGPEWQRFGEFVQQRLSLIGVKASLRYEDVATWLKRTYTDYDFSLTSNFLYNLPDPVLGVHRAIHGKLIKQGTVFVNGSRWSNPRSDELMDKATIEPDPKKRAEYYHEVQKIAVEASPIVWVFELNFPTVVNRSYKNVITSPLGLYTNFATVWRE